MDHGSDGRALLQSTTLRRAPQGAFALHHVANRDRREEAFRQGALTAEKRPVRKTDRVRANNDASVARRGFEPLTSSLKGIRSREAAWRILRARIETGFEPKRTSD